MSLILVNTAELVLCAANLSSAMETYQTAVAAAQAAADTLAAEWKGAAREAFVAEQAEAYRWHTYILQVARGMIRQLNDTVREYEETEAKVRGQI